MPFWMFLEYFIPNWDIFLTENLKHENFRGATGPIFGAKRKVNGMQRSRSSFNSRIYFQSYPKVEILPGLHSIQSNYGGVNGDQSDGFRYNEAHSVHWHTSDATQVLWVLIQWGWIPLLAKSINHLQEGWFDQFLHVHWFVTSHSVLEISVIFHLLPYSPSIIRQQSHIWIFSGFTQKRRSEGSCRHLSTEG